MVTHHGRIMADHVQTWSALKNHGTMVNFLPGSEPARCRCEMNSAMIQFWLSPMQSVSLIASLSIRVQILVIASNDFVLEY